MRREWITGRELKELQELERRRQRREKIRSWILVLLWLAFFAVLFTYCHWRG